MGSGYSTAKQTNLGNTKLSNFVALSKQNRLRSSRDFARVHHKGARAATQNLALRALKKNALLLSKPPFGSSQSADGDPSALSSCFGISISRKVSKRAVVRNRIKRQLKAIIRRNLPYIATNWQVVIVVRPAAVACEFDDFLRELEDLLKKLSIVKDHR